MSSHHRWLDRGFEEVGRAKGGDGGCEKIPRPNPGNSAQVGNYKLPWWRNTKANSGIRRILKSLVQASDANKDGKTEVKELEDFSDFDLVAWTWPGFLRSVKDDLKRGMRFCRFLIIFSFLFIQTVKWSPPEESINIYWRDMDINIYLNRFSQARRLLSRVWCQPVFSLGVTISFISSVRSSNSHPDLLLIHHPTFSDHTGPQ